MKKSAFTLIELLVVIVIIGILATLTTATFSGSRQKADEAKVLAERSDACKEALADCIEQQNGNCQSFDSCVTPRFTITTNGVDPNFESYVGTWFDSGNLTQYDTPVYTNGTAGALAYISPVDLPIDPTYYTWEGNPLLLYDTFAAALAHDANVSDYPYFTNGGGSGDISDSLTYDPVGYINILP